ncbi:MAG: WD40/YVTN/BNR-like repeat-containing protein [Flavobacteriaceae bacterium]
MKSKTFITALILVSGLFLSQNLSSQEIKSFRAVQEFEIEGQSIRALYPICSQEVYYASDQGRVAHSKDAGATWSKVDLDSTALRSIAMDKKKLFVLSIANPARLIAFNKKLKKQELRYTQEHTSVFYDAMMMDSSGFGLAIGDPTQGVMSVITTNDHGENWNLVTPASLTPAVDGEAAFAASNSNVKIIDAQTAYFVSGGMVSRFYQTHDQGKTWETSELPLLNGKPTTGAYTMDFYDASRGIVFGGDYTDKGLSKDNIALTSDAGKTWSVVPQGDSPGYRSCVQYVPGGGGEEILAVGTPGLSYSNDGGKTWQTDSRFQNYYTLRFVDENTLWMAGHEKMALVKINR